MVAFEHERYRGPNERVAGGDVEPEGFLQEPRRRIEQGPRHGAAHVVHHDVEPAQLSVGALSQGGHEVEVGQVSRDHDGAASRRFDPLRHLGQLLLGAGGEDDVGTGFGQGHRGGSADAAPTGRDDGDLVGHEELVEDHPGECSGRDGGPPMPWVLGSSGARASWRLRVRTRCLPRRAVTQRFRTS